jgi:hypothetical protein
MINRNYDQLFGPDPQEDTSLIEAVESAFEEAMLLGEDGVAIDPDVADEMGFGTEEAIEEEDE